MLEFSGKFMYPSAVTYNLPNMIYHNYLHLFLNLKASVDDLRFVRSVASKTSKAMNGLLLRTMCVILL